MTTDLSIFESEETFAAFSWFFHIVQTIHQDHPLYEPNVMKEVYQLARFNPNEHVIQNAVTLEDERLLIYLIEETYPTDDEFYLAIVNGMRAGKMDRVAMLCDLSSIPSRRILFHILDAPIDVFQNIFENMFTIIPETVFYNNLVEHAIQVANMDILEFLLTYDVRTPRSWLRAMILNRDLRAVKRLVHFSEVSAEEVNFACRLELPEEFIAVLQTAAKL